MKKRPITQADRDGIIKLYREGFKSGDGALDSFCNRIGRHKATVCKIAKSMGLTNKSRAVCGSQIEEHSKRHRKWHEDNEHPRGMLGKHHSPETCAKLGPKFKAAWAARTEEEKAEKTMKMMKTRYANGNLVQPRVKTTWKQGWREIGGIRKYYRSRWEANYARYLEWLKSKGEIESWLHEPDVFWFEAIKRGCRSYLPDFKVTENGGAVVYHEVKGWMDARSKTKIKRMAKYHPDVKLIIIDKPVYMDIKNKMCRIIDGWEE